MPSSSNDTLSPEMIKILKIFGLGSVLFVLLLSFFNERRANNTGEDENPMMVSDQDRLFFKNMRAPYYDIEGREDAKINIYRYGKRIKSSGMPTLNLSILLNRVKDEAYIFVEPSPENLPLRLKWRNESLSDSGELVFYGGDKFAHYDFVRKLYPLLEENLIWERTEVTSPTPILQEETAREALKITIRDYDRLTNNPK
jgi:hypothetical protein